MIVLNSAPTGTARVGDCIELKFTMTGINTGTIRRKFAFVICDDGGNEISREEAVNPKDGLEFCIRLEKDLLPLVFTEPPEPGAITTQIEDQPEMKKDITVKFWEYVFDTSTCQEPTKENEGSATITILNSACGYYGETNGILNYKPTNYELCRDSEDYIYFCVDAQVNVSIRWYDIEGNFLVGTTTQNIQPGAARSIGIGGGNRFPGGLPNNAYSGRIELTGAINKIFSYTIADCKCEDIYFLSQKGGYSAVSMERRSATVKTTFDEVCTFQPICDVKTSEGRKKGGRAIGNRQANRTITFSKIVDVETEADKNYYVDFLSSGVMWIKEKDNEGSEGLIRFIPRGGSLKYFESEECFELTITGEVAIPEPYPNYQNY